MDRSKLQDLRTLFDQCVEQSKQSYGVKQDQKASTVRTARSPSLRTALAQVQTVDPKTPL